MEISEYWRRLALQLETHRTQALQLLRDVMAGTASRTRIRRFLATTPDLVTHQHVKRGSRYVLLGIGKMQSEHWHDHGGYSDDNGDWPSVDMREVAIYRSVEDDSLWARPKEEFEDGRFEEVRPL